MKTKIFNIIIIVSLVWNAVNSYFVWSAYKTSANNNSAIIQGINITSQNIGVIGNFLNDITNGALKTYVENIIKTNKK